jgi:hypothetical protein
VLVYWVGASADEQNRRREPLDKSAKGKKVAHSDILSQARETPAMYIRFATWQIDPESQRSRGIFQVVFQLRDLGWLRLWFDANLEKPTRFTASKPPHYRKASKAISWFKDNAKEHIAKMREMAAILESHGQAVRVLKAQRVGYVVYEDEWQIVAEPFSDVEC